jgi:Cu-Zn family superoxide dismutase
VIALAAFSYLAHSASAAPKEALFAKTDLQAKSGSTASGTVEFFKKGNEVVIEAKVAGVSPGEHGFHLHEKGDCSAPDASSAGGHFNPLHHPHAGPHTAQHHAGDFGNITVKADGTGTMSLTLKGEDAKIAREDAIGKAIILHEKADDLKTQPTGNAGGRIACGVVEKATAPSSR